MLEALLAIGLLLTTATQLRPAQSPVGPGEICLVIWILPMLLRELRRLGPPLTPALKRLLIFWTVFALAQSLGTLTALAIGDVHDPRWFMHDVMAYPLLAVFSCLCVVQPGAESRLRRVAWLLVAFGTASLAPQLAAASGLVGLPVIEVWFEDRFQGWSENPNQLAMLSAVLVLVCLHLADTSERTGKRITAVACAIVPLCVGRLTKSDTFTFVLIAAGPVFLLLKLRVWLASPGRTLTLRFAFACIVVLSIPLLIASAMPLAAGTDSENLVLGLTKNGGKEAEREAELRMELWQEAISRGMDAWMLGLGPGPHLPMPPSIIAAREGGDTDAVNNDHPSISDIPNFEAHNTYFDMFTQGGLLAVGSVVWLAATALIVTYKARAAGLTTLVCCLLLYAMTGLIIRPPIFWFAIVLCLVAGDPRGTPLMRNWT